MSGRQGVFFDTNVLLYAHLCQDIEKQTMARKLIAQAMQQDDCYISTQVIQEFCNNMLKKAEATEVQVSVMLHKIQESFTIVPVQMPAIEKALNVKGRYGFSFWDSLIVACALELHCRVLYTEDLQDGGLVSDTLRIANPFIH